MADEWSTKQFCHSLAFVCQNSPPSMDVGRITQTKHSQKEALYFHMSLLPEMAHDQIGKAQVKVYTEQLWIFFDPLCVGLSWNQAKHFLQTPERGFRVAPSGRNRLLQEDDVLAESFSSCPQGPNAFMESDGLHERVRCCHILLHYNCSDITHVYLIYLLAYKQ